MRSSCVGVSPCSGCETGHPSPPFALRSATTMGPQPPRSGSRHRHDVPPAGTIGLDHDPTTNGSTACRMRSAYRLHGSGTGGPCVPPAARSRRRLPGTTGLRFALHGRQRLLLANSIQLPIKQINFTLSTCLRRSVQLPKKRTNVLS